MDSPQHHHAPHAMHSPGHVAPINLGLPLHATLPAPGNNPFLAPPVPAPVPAPAPAPVVHNGQQYNHLPAALAQQLAAMPPIPVHVDQRVGHGRGHGHANVVPPPIIPPAQGRGHGQGHAPAPAPAAMVCWYNISGCFLHSLIYIFFPVSQSTCTSSSYLPSSGLSPS